MTTFFELVSEDFEPDPPMYPGKVAVRDGAHWLEVLADPEEDFGIEHSFDCIDEHGWLACTVSYVQETDDVHQFFHLADVDECGDRLTDGLLPGRYLIKAYCEEYRSRFYPYEDDLITGLELVYPEEAQCLD